jgi:hypothetical protein
LLVVPGRRKMARSFMYRKGTAMSHATIGAAPPVSTPAPPINLFNLVWVGLALVVMVVVIRLDNVWALNFLHVMAGVMWTGIDLFMGFVIGPILRTAPFEARRAIIMRLTPKTLFIMPTLSTITGTTGWYHAKQLGFLDLGYPQFWWVVAALVIVAILTVQGIGYLLPTNLRVYMELRKPNPDGAKIGRLMSNFFYVVAFQGCMQIAIIVVMAKFVTGI